tara:strand:+ start:18783 stop:19655 length:873 start_codon:yes stop_codon:yes gene_type:complete
MKHFHSNLLLTFLYLSYSTFSLAQSYASVFGSESTTWKIPFCNLDQFIITEQVSNSDIIYNSNSYKKIGTSYTGGVDYELNSVSGNGWARENTNEGKVWFVGTVETINGFDTVEYLVMDLSMEIGDDFLVYESFGETDLAIVDSIYFDAGFKHVRTTYQHWNNDEKLTFIEGIGTNYGLAYMHNYMNMCNCLLSVNKDLLQVYSNNNCLPTAEYFEEELNELTLYPNPAVNSISINHISNSGIYKILSVLGEEVKHTSFEGKNIQIDISELRPNIYFIEIDNQILKFIKE